MSDLTELEKQAMNHKPCDDSANAADLCYYWTMRSVYDSLRVKKLSKDEAKDAKRKAISLHKDFTDYLSRAFGAYKYREDATRALSCVGAELHKADDLESKYRIALKAISAVTGEKVTENTEVRWIEVNRKENP